MYSTLNKLISKIFVRVLNNNVAILERYFYNYLLCTPKFYGGLKNITISPKSNVNNGLFNSASGKILVNDYVFFGHNVTILAATHDYTKFGIERMQTIPESGYDIIIDEGAWICTNSVIIGPCRIGKHAVVLPGSVVTKDVGEYEMCGGVPAKTIKIIKNN